MHRDLKRARVALLSEMAVQIEGRHPVRARELSQSVRLAGGQTDREKEREGEREGAGWKEGQSFSALPSLPPFHSSDGRTSRAREGIHSTWLRPRCSASLGFRLALCRSVGLPSVRVCPFGVNHILSSRDRLLSTGLMVIVLFYCFCGKLPGSGTPCNGQGGSVTES